MATDPTPTPSYQVDLRRQNLPLAESFNDLLLQRLLRDFSVAVIIFTPPERACDFDVFNRDTGLFQLLLILFRELFSLPVHVPFHNIEGVLNIFVPAASKKPTT